MLSNTTLYLLVAAFLSSELTYAATSPNDTSKNSSTIPEECHDSNNEGEIYRHPNASNSYPIPAVVQSRDPTLNVSTAPFSVSTNQTWQLITALGQNTNSVNNESQLQSLLFLDTKSQEPVPAPVSSALSGSLLRFDFSKDDEAAPVNGDCSSLIGQDCVNDIQDSVRTIRRKSQHARLRTMQFIKLKSRHTSKLMS